jgi:hypothetical protein
VHLPALTSIPDPGNLLFYHDLPRKKRTSAEREFNSGKQGFRRIQ